jgi:hypothetical protein
MNYPIGVTKGLATWDFQNHSVERVTDNGSYDAAHPDDTLLLAGPARSEIANATANTGGRTLFSLGLFQSFNWTSTAPVQPMMAIGSGRSFYLRGKSQTQWQVSRILMNGKNLLRALYHNAVEAGVPVNEFDDPVSFTKTDLYFTNLDSELYYVPFGLGVIMRSKSHTLIGSIYFELCCIGTWGSGITAGQAIVVESVSGLSDRIMRFAPSDEGRRRGVPRRTIDAILGIGPTAFPVDSRDAVATGDDSDLGTPDVPAVV